MRIVILVASVVLAWATSPAPAQDPASEPTRVNEEGVYECPNHPDILATWPAQCPMCQTVLNPVPPTPASAETTPIVAQDRRGQEEREERERGERFREEVRRRGEFGRRYYDYPRYGYPRYGYPRYVYPPYSYQPYTYVYPPQLYFGPPPAGYSYYPNQGYYYNPDVGLYYYPNQGYFYSPSTGNYYSYSPGQGYFYFSFPIR